MWGIESRVFSVPGSPAERIELRPLSVPGRNDLHELNLVSLGNVGIPRLNRQTAGKSGFSTVQSRDVYDF